MSDARALTSSLVTWRQARSRQRGCVELLLPDESGGRGCTPKDAMLGRW